MLPHCKDGPQQSHLGFLYLQHQETDPCSVMKLLFQTWGWKEKISWWYQNEAFAVNSNKLRGLLKKKKCWATPHKTGGSHDNLGLLYFN